MKRLIIGAALAVCLATSVGTAFADVPTVDAVQQEVQSGNLAHAEAMMQQVVAAKPQSAKAHYIYAEILARNGRFDVAAQEARTAKQIDPAVKFTQPDKFATFEQTLEREQQRARDVSGRRSSAAPTGAVSQERPAAVSAGMPSWIWILGAVALIVVLFKAFTRNAGAPVQGAPVMPGSSMNPGGYGGGFGVNQGMNQGYNQGMPMQGRMGGGMLGTGVAAAGGFAAGMLAEDLLKGRHDASAATLGDGGGSGDAGNQYASDLEQRQVDFGSGGNWDDNAGGGGGGGGFDSGGGGGGSDDSSGW